jgi:hypothetical protein
MSTRLLGVIEMDIARYLLSCEWMESDRFIVNNSGNIASTRVKGGMPVIVFAPRKGKLVLYLEQKLIQFSELLEKLGKHTTSKACLYIKRLNDVDESVLWQLVEQLYRRALNRN